MAKELPYFKFFVSEWNDGDITLEVLETQGLFINICSYYWSNECELTLTKTKKKFRFASDESFKALVDSEIIKVNDDIITINFLDEQQLERNAKSLTNSNAGKASAEKRRLKKIEDQRLLNLGSTENQRALELCSTESQPLREEERREEKKREEKKIKETIDFIYSLYPTKCPIKECSTGKSIKCKDKIKELLKTKSKEELENTITKYLLDCKKSKTWLRNFKTLLNDLPDYSEEIENNKSIYTEIMKKENITLEMLKFESIEKLEKWEKTKKWTYDQNGVKEDWKTYFTKLLKNRI